MGDDSVQSSVIVYYCTEMGKVKGELEVTENRIFFNPLKCEENKDHKHLKPFKVVIDMGDLLATVTKKLINESGAYVTDPDLANSYMYDFYLQFDLADVNRES